MTDFSSQHAKIINQLFEIEKKVNGKPENASIQRNIDRIKNTFEEIGLYIYNPMGESYNETRTDCEATIAGTATDDLKITSVIKPVIFEKSTVGNRIVQKGVVVVESWK
ncbi:MAG: hypothetical protein MUD08_00590 [Cytophagales bacterium]|jgi:hypothetical protein|nr:hypothetical protein [Cytophagales bacterium]